MTQHLSLALALALCASATHALNNGVGRLPEMGFNSWYAFHSHLTNYQWTGGFVAGEEIVKEAEFFVSSGLLAAGYK